MQHVYLIFYLNIDPQDTQKINYRFLHSFLTPLEPTMCFGALAEYTHQQTYRFKQQLMHPFQVLTPILKTAGRARNIQIMVINIYVP